MNSISLDQRKALAVEATTMGVPVSALLKDRLQGDSNRTLLPMIHELEWEMVAQSTKRKNNS